MFSIEDGNIVTKICIYAIKVNYFVELGVFSYYYYNEVNLDNKIFFTNILYNNCFMK